MTAESPPIRSIPAAGQPDRDSRFARGRSQPGLWGKRLAGLALAGTVLAMGYSERAAIADTVHHLTAETTSEQRLSDSLRQAFGITVAVHCVSQESITALTSDAGERAPDGWDGPTTGLTVIDMTGRPVSIRLSQAHCDSLDMFPGTPDGIVGSRQADALGLLAHEAAHVAGTSDESDAECYGVQMSLPLARALGATAAQAAEARQLITYGFSLPVSVVGSSHLMEYAITDDCRPGGRLDLGLENDNDNYPPTGRVRTIQVLQ